MIGQLKMFTKKLFLKIIATIVGIGVIGGLMFLPHKKHHDDTILRVGTSDDYPPYTFNQDGKIVGFDIDLAAAVAKKLDKKFEVKAMSFSSLLLELDRGSVDLLAGGITPRKTVFNVKFTDAYIAGDPFIIISKNNLPDGVLVCDLFNKKVVVNEGYTSDFFLSAYPEINLIRLETVAEAILALKTKKADFFVVAKTVIDPFLKANPLFPFFKKVLCGVTESYAFVISGHNQRLFNDVQKALQELKDDGTIDDLKNKWNVL